MSQPFPSPLLEKLAERLRGAKFSVAVSVVTMVIIALVFIYGSDYIIGTQNAIFNSSSTVFGEFHPTVGAFYHNSYYIQQVWTVITDLLSNRLFLGLLVAMGILYIAYAIRFKIETND